MVWGTVETHDLGGNFGGPDSFGSPRTFSLGLVHHDGRDLVRFFREMDRRLVRWVARSDHQRRLVSPGNSAGRRRLWPCLARTRPLAPFARSHGLIAWLGNGPDRRMPAPVRGRA